MILVGAFWESREILNNIKQLRLINFTKWRKKIKLFEFNEIAKVKKKKRIEKNWNDDLFQLFHDLKWFCWNMFVLKIILFFFICGYLFMSFASNFELR